jgi:hypothetical protein
MTERVPYSDGEEGWLFPLRPEERKRVGAKRWLSFWGRRNQ